MDVTLHERTPVDFDLEIRASHDELEPRLNEALKAQRKRMNLKGFRPGRVPINLVKKMYGGAIAAQIAEEVIGEVWREEVADDPSRDVLGAPRLAEMNYDLGEDLHAVLRFGVRPEIELADTSGTTVRRLVRPVGDEDVEEEVQRRLRRAAKAAPTEEPIDADSEAVVDLQLVDKESGTAVIGQRSEGQEVDLTDERLREELRTALLGKKAGDEFRVDLPHQHDEDEGHDHVDHVDRFLVTVREVRHRDLPELDEAFVKEQTAGRYETVEDYRGMVRREIEDASRRLGQDFLREEIVRALLEAHDFPVPESLVESALDEMEEDLARRVGGELPPQFDREGYRDAQRDAARHQARWMLLKDRVLADADVELTEADFEAEFERLASTGPGTAEMVKQFVAAQPQMMENVRLRLLNERLFDALEARFTVTEVTSEELEAESAETEPAADKA